MGSPKFSKSKLMTGLQCDKAFYLQMHHPRLARPNTLSEERTFKQGHDVGALAHTLFPHGKKVDFPAWEYEKSVAATLDLLEQNCAAIFEAAFEYENIYARIDILENKGKSWDLIEVKSSTKPKEEHLTDIAIQAHILRKLKIPVERYYLLHVNNQCVFPYLKEFFSKVDVTEEVLALSKDIEKQIAHLKKIYSHKSIPEIDIGPHCLKPYECRFKDHCWAGLLLPQPNIFQVPGLKDQKWSFYKQGIVNVHDIPIDEISEPQKKVVNVLKTGEPYINKKIIKDFLDQLEWPLYFLDFETLNPAIPNLKGLKPFMHYTFQYSCHLQETSSSEFKHFEYLHTDTTDPRKPLAQHLCKHIGNSGSIISYFKSFEGSRLKEMVESLPELKEKLLNIESRLMDPLPILQAAVYFPEFENSYSLKSVGPALIGEQLNYENLDVQDGTMAQDIFEKMIVEKNEERKNKMIFQLKQYCNQDTMALVKILEWMKNQI